MKLETVTVDDLALVDFRRIYKKLYDENIGYEEGKEVATNLLGLVKFLFDKQNVHEKRIQKATTK